MKIDLRDLALAYLWEYIGTWYSWGGDDPEGFDCSGIVVEVLKGVGLMPRGSDMTADALRLAFPGTNNPVPGCLCLWQARGEERAVHVEMIYKTIDGVHYTVGASGGGSRTTSKEQAMKDNAFVKLRPARAGVWCYVNPFA